MSKIETNLASRAIVTGTTTPLAWLASDGASVFIHEWAHKFALELLGHSGEVTVDITFINTLYLLDSLGFDIEPLLLAMYDGNGIAAGSVQVSESFRLIGTDFERIVTASAPYLLNGAVLSVAFGLCWYALGRESDREHPVDIVLEKAAFTVPVLVTSIPFALDAIEQFSLAQDGAMTDITKIAHIIGSDIMPLEMSIGILAVFYLCYVMAGVLLAFNIANAAVLRNRSTNDVLTTDEEAEEVTLASEAV